METLVRAQSLKVEGREGAEGQRLDHSLALLMLLPGCPGPPLTPPDPSC